MRAWGSVRRQDDPGYLAVGDDVDKQNTLMQSRSTDQLLGDGHESDEEYLQVMDALRRTGSVDTLQRASSSDGLLGDEYMHVDGTHPQDEYLQVADREACWNEPMLLSHHSSSGAGSSARAEDDGLEYNPDEFGDDDDELLDPEEGSDNDELWFDDSDMPVDLMYADADTRSQPVLEPFSLDDVFADMPTDEDYEDMATLRQDPILANPSCKCVCVSVSNKKNRRGR